jgi:hypothetical protein
LQGFTDAPAGAGAAASLSTVCSEFSTLRNVPRTLVMVLHSIVAQVTDQDRWEVLGRVAESQGGYVTTAQAEEAGFHRNALRHHAREGGRLEHAGRGLYRLRFYPSSPFDHVGRRLDARRLRERRRLA